MSMDVSTYLNLYNSAIDQAALNDNIKLVLNNASQKDSKTPDTIFEQNFNNANSALLFEYTQNIGRSNVAQQLCLDGNLKETLKFLCSEAAKKMTQNTKRKFGSIVEHIFTGKNTKSFNPEEDELENENDLLLELMDIKVDNSKKNIFAA